MKAKPTWRIPLLLLCLLVLPLFCPASAHADILWRNTATGQNAVWYMNGATLASGEFLNALPDQTWTIAGTGDFNADGKPDILWRNTATGQNAVWYMNGATFLSGAFLTNAPLVWSIVGVGDFNADGKPDILWRNTATGENYVWYMNGATLLSGAFLNPLGDLNWKIVGVADFNADGKPDILWRNTATGQNAIWYMNGATFSSGVYLNSLPDLTWAIVGVADSDADGKPDILWRNTATGQNAIWYMNGANGATFASGEFLTTMPDQNWKIVAPRPAVISGTVKAPGGTLAFYPQPGLLERIAKLFTSSADAALSGVSNVADGTVVELVQIDDTGNTLSVVATATVAGGTYSFNLTNLHVAYSSDLIAQVRNQTTGARMRAFVISGTVNIDPVSEALVRTVLEKIVAIAGTLNAFTPQELSNLTSNMDFLTTAKQAAAGAGLETTVTTMWNLLTTDPALASFLTAAAAPGQTTQAPGDVGNYFPVGIGNKWEARITVTETEQPTVTYTDVTEITGTRLFNGVSTLVFQESDPSRGILGEDYRTKTSAGITYYGSNGALATYISQLAPYAEVLLPLRTGASFEQMNRSGIDYGEDLDGDGLNETFSVYSTVTVVGFETVTVDAGTFYNCAKLQTTLTVTFTLSGYGMEMPVTAAVTEWYASGIGLVKRYTLESTTGYSITEDYVLVAYSADGQHGGIVIMPSFIVSSAVAPANSDAESPGRPSIAYDGTNYLMISRRVIDYLHSTITGTFISSTTGSVVGTFDILNQGYLGSNRSAVAFDGTNYLVVYQEDTQIVGQRISRSGALLDGPNGFVISGGTPWVVTNYYPAVAFDGTNYLVVWAKFNANYDIYGALVSPSGQVSNEFVVSAAPGEQIEPSIAFDGNNYFVVWRDTRSGSGPASDTDIYGTRVTRSGTVLDSAGLPISTAPGVQGAPQIIYDGTNYFAAWSDQRNSMSYLNNDVYGSRIGVDGALLDGPSSSGGIAINTASYNISSLSVAHIGNNYLVAWASANFTNSPPAGIFAARVSTDGSLVNAPSSGTGMVVSGPPPSVSRYVYPVIFCGGTNALLVWINNIELTGIKKDVEGSLIYPF